MESTTNLIAVLGDRIHLYSKMHSFDMSNTTVTWSKFHNGSYKVIADNPEPSKDGITGNVKIKTNNEDTSLTLAKIGYDDSGKYLVNISNDAGEESHECILTVEGPPLPPSSPPDVKYNTGTNTILVAWAGSSYDGGSAVTGYFVEVSIKSATCSKKNEKDTWSLLNRQSANWMCYTIAEPTPNASYKFRIRAVNAYGQGEPSLSSEDLFISDNSDSNSSYRSRDSSRQSSLQGYLSEDLEGKQMFSISPSPAQAPKIVMGPTNLIALVGETIHLRVKMHSFDMSNTTVTWSKFQNGSYKVIADNAEPYKDDITGNVKISTNNEITTLTFGKVSYDDSGKYLVNIDNGVGDDSHVCILTVEGPPVPPASPPDVKYNPVTNTILVEWTGSPYDGGSAVTGYHVEVSIKSSTSSKNIEKDIWSLLTPQSGNWLCYTIAEPTPNASYKIRIRAVNAYGQGEPSMSSEDLFISHNSDSNISYRSVSRQSSLQNYCSEVDDEDRSESDVTSFREYVNVKLKPDKFFDYYETHEELGKGRYGVVCRVLQKLNGESYVGKFIKCIKEKGKQRAHLEFNIMNDLKYHPKLLCLIDGFEMFTEIVIITEMINGGALFERVVADDFTLKEHDCIDFLRQISAGVEYIHSKNIMHLDLKPENILCTTKSSNLIKIIDFGFAKYYNPENPTQVLFGTAEFVSPEIINYETICPKADMWSLGVITYILLSGLSPFMGHNDHETYSNITIGEFDFDDDSFENVSEDAKDFISSLIVKRKEKRLSAKECLEHKWLIQCSDVERKDIIIPTEELKRFLVRRKLQKTEKVKRAQGRIPTVCIRRRSSSVSSANFLPSSSSFMRSFSTPEPKDNDNISLNNFHPSVSPLSVSLGKDKRISPICEGTVTKYNGTNDSSNDTLDESVNSNKSKYNESCRSDSGICDVVGP